MKLKIKGLFGKLDYDLDLSNDLNILVGENGKGKSTILKIITYVFNMNFAELTKIKFRSLELSFENNFHFFLDYNDLFANIESYWGSYSIKVEEEKNKEFEKIMSNFELGINNKNVSNALDDKLILSKLLVPDSANTKLIYILLEKFSLFEFNSLVSIIINYQDRNEFIYIISQLANAQYVEPYTKSIFSFIENYFYDENRNSKTTTLKSFSNFIKQVNKKVNPIVDKIEKEKNSEVSFINNSNLLNNGLFLSLLSPFKTNKLELNIFKEKQSKYFLNYNFINLNMVELSDITGSLENLQIFNSKFETRSNFKKSSYEAQRHVYEYLNFFTSDEIATFMDNYIEIISEDTILNFDSTSKNYDSDESRFELCEGIDKYYYALKQNMKKFVSLQDNNIELKEKFEKIKAFDTILESTIEELYVLNQKEFVFYKIKNELSLIKTALLHNLIKKTFEAKLSKSLNLSNLINKYLYDKSISIDIDYELIVKQNKTNSAIPLEFLSSGEKKLLTIIINIFFGNKDTIYLIDEPELSLSIAWQEILINDLLSIIKENKAKIIIATQSNHIVNDNLVKCIVPLTDRKI